MAPNLILFLVLVCILHLLLSQPLHAAVRRVHISDDLDDVVDNEEDEDWKEWGKPKPKPAPKFDPPPDFKDGMDISHYQMEMMKRQIAPSVGFVKLRLDVQRARDDSTRIARKWTELLKSGGIDAKIVSVDRSTIMFTIPDGQDTLEVKDFVLNQEEAYEFKLGQNTFRRPGDPPLEVVVERLKQANEAAKASAKEEL